MNINLCAPAFPKSRPIDIADKPVLDQIFADLQPMVSELTFANLFLFRTAHDYRLTTIGDSPVIIGRGYDGEACFLPPFKGDIPGALRELFAAGLALYGADESFADRFLRDHDLLLTEDRDSFDYIYLRRDLAELTGNRFHKKKNRVNYFTARHNYTIEMFVENLAPGCLTLLQEWTRVRGDVTGNSARLEADAAAESIRMAGLLGLEGLVVLVDGTVKAFAIGERLNKTTSVCHFEKADPFMEGISQLVDREFNRLLFTDCVYVNREQDLGEPGLRAAKLSYHPVELLKKYRARIN